MNHEVEQQPTRSNTTLWILILIFAIPMVGAYAYFFLADNYSMGNHGKLIKPVIQIEALQLADADGKTLSRDELIHKWKMFYIADNDCDADCQQSLYHMRQINIALGKNANRFEHMVIHMEPMTRQFRQLIAQEHEAALHTYGNREVLTTMLGNLEEKQLTSNAIYIMDPLGNIMMRFEPGTDPKLILKDLNKLLKISRIG